MERLLTPLISRLLRRFIKEADGQQLGTLRVGFSKGSLVLHDLELNLDGEYANAWNGPDFFWSPRV